MSPTHTHTHTPMKVTKSFCLRRRNAAQRERVREGGLWLREGEKNATARAPHSTTGTQRRRIPDDSQQYADAAPLDARYWTERRREGLQTQECRCAHRLLLHRSTPKSRKPSQCHAPSAPSTLVPRPRFAALRDNHCADFSRGVFQRRPSRRHRFARAVLVDGRSTGGGD
jgi:hypothetical protein